MPEVKGIGRKKKRRKLAPVAPTKVTPDKEDGPDEEAEEPEFDDEVIEEAVDTVMDTVIEKMIDVDFMVKTQVFRLHKREIVAAATREAMEEKFKRVSTWSRDDSGERDAWWMVYNEAIEELCDFQDEWGIDCPTCGSSPACCGCNVDCRCGSRHPRYAWILGYRCKLRCSPASPFIGE